MNHHRNQNYAKSSKCSIREYANLQHIMYYKISIKTKLLVHNFANVFSIPTLLYCVRNLGFIFGETPSVIKDYLL